jgi:hypothetical protein
LNRKKLNTKKYRTQRVLACRTGKKSGGKIGQKTAAQSPITREKAGRQEKKRGFIRAWVTRALTRLVAGPIRIFILSLIEANYDLRALGLT